MKKIFLKLFVLFISFIVFTLQTDASKLQDQINAGLLRPKTLKAISALPKNNSNNLQTITSMFLEDIGYPGSFIPVKFLTSNTSGYEGDITGGHFNLLTGEMHLNPALAKAPPGHAAAIIRHELDHFQKAAQLCKSIGINNYVNLFGGNDVNASFWQKTMVYTKVPAGFNSQKYLAGITKYTATTDITGPYHIYNNRTDSRRNVFEISAYNLSDAVYEYFKIPTYTTTLEKVANAFNSVDWKVYNLSKKYPVLSNERVAIFDYFYAKTIIQRDPSMQQAFTNSMRANDMYIFWSLDRQKRNSFYNSSNIDSKTSNEIISLLNAVNNNIPSSLTIKQTRDILELKYLTLRSALKHENKNNYLSILLNLNKTTNNYMKFLDTYSSRDDGTRLKLLLTRLQLLQISFQIQNGQVKKIGKPEDTKKVIEQIYKSKDFSQICKNQNKNACFENLLKANKLY